MRVGFPSRRLGAALVLSLLVAVIPVAHDAVGSAAAAGDPNTLNLDINGFVPVLDPQVNYDLTSGTFLPACYDGLLQVVGAKKAVFKPDLATSWKESADGKTWTFALRQGVKFHDGTTFDANAVKFTYDRLLKLGKGAAGDFSEISKIIVVNPNTVQFVLKYPASFFLPSLTTIWGTGIVSPTGVKKHMLNAADYGQKWLLDHEDGTGAYMLDQASYNPNTSMTLVKFPDYWGGWAGKHFDKVVIQFITQSTTERLMLQRGDLDGTMGLTPQDVAAVAKDPNLVVHQYTAQTIKDIRMNDRYGPTANVLVRQALSYAWDYQGMVTGAYNGHASVLEGIEPPGFVHYVKPAHPYTFDLNKAKALFARAGYSKGLTLTFDYVPGDAEVLRMAEIFQADLAQIGVTLKLQGMNVTVYNQLIQNAKTLPEIFAGAWTMDYPDDQQGYWYQYTTVNDPKRITDKTLDNLILAGMKSSDDATAMRYYTKAVNRIYDAAYSLWTVQPDETVVLAKDIKGYQYNYVRSSYDFNIYDMYRA